MEAFEAIRTLLAVRSYKDTPVPDDVVRRIVEAGRLTGSGMNRQPWHFIVIRERETLRRLGALASSGSYVAQAPLAIVVAPPLMQGKHHQLGIHKLDRSALELARARAHRAHPGDAALDNRACLRALHPHLSRKVDVGREMLDRILSARFQLPVLDDDRIGGQQCQGGRAVARG
jgi:nitroreductase